MTDTERLNWLARMVSASVGDDPEKAEVADAVGDRFNRLLQAAQMGGKPVEDAFREAIDGSQLGL